jgi:multidrug resistance efflux pump
MRVRTDTLGSVADMSAMEVDDDVWTRFKDASTVEEVCESWLSLQCQLITNVRAGIVLLGLPNAGPFQLVACWPPKRQPSKHLRQTAERTLAKRRLFLTKRDSNSGRQPELMSYEIGYPIEVHGQLHGVAVLELAPAVALQVKAIIRQMQWGAASLKLLFAQESVTTEIQLRERLQSAFDLVVAAAGHERFYSAAIAFVTAVSTRLDCSRVSLGFLQNGRTHIVAVSHSADFNKRTNVVRRIADVMDEAIDQRQTVVFPPPTGSSLVLRAHTDLSQTNRDACICSIPFRCTEAIVGAVTLERVRDRPFDANTVQLCQSVTALAGPFLDLHWREDRWLPVKAVDSCRRYLAALLGPRHIALKIGTAAIAALLAFLLVTEGDYRVSAKTVLEPIVQRTAAAPFDGYIREAAVRPGHVVHAGDLLATLDDRELRLDRLKALSRYQEHQKAYNKAMAERNAAEGAILTAQMQQAQVEIELLDDQLRHTRLLAPFDGIVVSGDLSQSLGAPIEKGKVLFEIAPLDEYRVVLEVDERDIAEVKPAQQGQLILSAFPNETLRFYVVQLTPVSTTQEGRNFFRVEAQLTQLHDRLRPGMEGVGKIEIDRRLFMWVWTHQLVDWVRLAVWSWLP